jgi:hypothetical protein
LGSPSLGPDPSVPIQAINKSIWLKGMSELFSRAALVGVCASTRKFWCEDLRGGPKIAGQFRYPSEFMRWRRNRSSFYAAF